MVSLRQNKQRSLRPLTFADRRCLLCYCIAMHSGGLPTAPMRIPLEVFIISLCCIGVLPCAVALFPQWGELIVGDHEDSSSSPLLGIMGLATPVLEEELRLKAVDGDGQPLPVVRYNKGL